MHISFEIVPRSLPAFTEQYAYVQSLGANINVINIPDIQRFSLRSWQLNQLIDRNKYQFVPHFRAIDFKRDGSDLSSIIEDYQLDKILLVSGDPPEGLNRTFYNTNVLELIRIIKQRFPDLSIYAGFDPHRQGLQDECDYILRKIEAGVTGFFSQPFYDHRLLEIYLEHMQGLDVYIGLSPITSQSSKLYWEVKNKVKFPLNFRPELDWNVDFANRVIETAEKSGFNIYFMPIKIQLNDYFSQIRFPK